MNVYTGSAIRAFRRHVTTPNRPTNIHLYFLFTNTLKNASVITPNGCKCLENRENGRDLLTDTILVFIQRAWGKPWQILNNIVGLLADIATQDLPNVKQEWWPLRRDVRCLCTYFIYLFIVNIMTSAAQNISVELRDDSCIINWGDRDLFWSNIPEFTWRDWGKSWKIPVTRVATRPWFEYRSYVLLPDQSCSVFLCLQCHWKK
jgi:hypothetical protein